MDTEENEQLVMAGCKVNIQCMGLDCGPNNILIWKCWPEVFTLTVWYLTSEVNLALLAAWKKAARWTSVVVSFYSTVSSTDGLREETFCQLGTFFHPGAVGYLDQEKIRVSWWGEEPEHRSKHVCCFKCLASKYISSCLTTSFAILFVPIFSVC